MTVEVFLGILVISAAATSIGIEIVKNMLTTFGVKYNPMVVAVFSAFAVGCAEMVIYLNKTGSTANIGYTVIYSLCMGIVNVVGTTTGYDTVKAFILALFGKKE